MAWAVRDVDEETYRELRPMLRAQMAEVRPLRSEMRSAMREFAEVVEREPFDAEAAARSLAALRAGSARYQAVLHRNMLAIMSGLSPQERLAVVRLLLHRGGRSHPRRVPPEAQRPPSPQSPASLPSAPAEDLR